MSTLHKNEPPYRCNQGPDWQSLLKRVPDTSIWRCDEIIWSLSTVVTCFQWTSETAQGAGGFISNLHFDRVNSSTEEKGKAKTRAANRILRANQDKPVSICVRVCRNKVCWEGMMKACRTCDWTQVLCFQVLLSCLPSSCFIPASDHFTALVFSFWVDLSVAIKSDFC